MPVNARLVSICVLSLYLALMGCDHSGGTGRVAATGAGNEAVGQGQRGRGNGIDNSGEAPGGSRVTPGSGWYFVPLASTFGPNEAIAGVSFSGDRLDLLIRTDSVDDDGNVMFSKVWHQAKFDPATATLTKESDTPARSQNTYDGPVRLQFPMTFPDHFQYPPLYPNQGLLLWGFRRWDRLVAFNVRTGAAGVLAEGIGGCEDLAVRNVSRAAYRLVVPSMLGYAACLV